MDITEFEEEEYTGRFSLAVWRKIFGFMRPYKKKFGILLALMVVVAGVDIVMPLLTRYAIDTFIIPGSLEGLNGFIAVYIVFAVVQALNIRLFIGIGAKIETFVAYDIRNAGFKRLQQLALSYFNRTPDGWVVARLTSDTERLGEALSWSLVDFVWGASMMLGIAGVMIAIDWQLALISLSVVPALLWISAVYQKRILAGYRTVRKTNSRITASFNESISGVLTTKTLVREKENLREFKRLSGEMYGSSFLAALFSAQYLPIVQLIGMAGSAIALWFGGAGVIAGGITYGTLVLFLTYMLRFFEPVNELARVFAELQNAQASAERVMSLIETEPEIRDSPASLSIPASLPMRGDVEFRNVGFAYKQGQTVLTDFNLTVEAGQTVALVGSTGGGKSTIVNLVSRFYEPTAGQILIDGVDYRDRTQTWLQSKLGIVLQEPRLFSGSIADNIRYGKLNATLDEIKAAARMAYADEFITRLEDGYDSEVGESGSFLSTGQKQLISLARAFIAKPIIFIMDEATSSVDTETEQRIQHAIESLVKDRTSFIIAHRLSTIVTADRILVIDRGRIVEQGNHNELLSLKGKYYELYMRQFGRASSVAQTDD